MILYICEECTLCIVIVCGIVDILLVYILYILELTGIFSLCPVPSTMSPHSSHIFALFVCEKRKYIRNVNLYETL